jgi:hypothetical protein
MASKGPAASLLDLPDPCLEAVLQFCADDDLCSMFSAARAHSRLHQAAAAALDSIYATPTQQQRVDGVLYYLSLHGQHINGLDLEGTEDCSVSLSELPPSLQLTSLELNGFLLQLQPGGGFNGVLGAAAGLAALKTLGLSNCQLRDGDEGMAAVLPLLPAGLEHLSFSGLTLHFEDGIFDTNELLLPTAELQRLQQLTYLELAHIFLQGLSEASPALQPLQALTQLHDLRITSCERPKALPACCQAHAT